MQLSVIALQLECQNIWFTTTIFFEKTSTMTHGEFVNFHSSSMDENSSA